MFDKHKTLYIILITIILTVTFTIIISNIIEPKSNIVNSGTDYIKLVDNVCYRATNENTEKYFNKSYVNGWGSVYRNCMLYNLNVHITEFDCIHWRCHKQDNDYTMDSFDFEKCEYYFRTSDYKYKSVCGDEIN